MTSIVNFPKGKQVTTEADEHLAYYTPETRSQSTKPAPAARVATGLEALDLMYEYYNAA
ncbi:hypothetical protein [Thioclava indica]|uniref:Uncharacterized protein n=1 Tax=Thioclava indica TaxID=1353528 RepID=A0A074JWZ4_9RHOB|nr:hypothetical protein [Thioclava indica]KEO53857.1 hypothetical protein DT23_06720 [Thioclava indica]